jgi:hypothetical protein
MILGRDDLLTSLRHQAHFGCVCEHCMRDLCFCLLHYYLLLVSYMVHLAQESWETEGFRYPRDPVFSNRGRSCQAVVHFVAANEIGCAMSLSEVTSVGD